MRRSVLSLVLAALFVVAVASALAKGAPPRLDGTFAVIGTIKGNDIGIAPGTLGADVYKFKSTCGKGSCAKVKLTRKAGGREIKSTLHKTAPGVYEGTEGPAPYVCVNPLGGKGEFTGDHKIKVTRKSKAGLAKKISGTTVIHITGCTETFEEVSLQGKLAP